jgi:hypothetical protein
MTPHPRGAPPTSKKSGRTNRPRPHGPRNDAQSKTVDVLAALDAFLADAELEGRDLVGAQLARRVAAVPQPAPTTRSLCSGRRSLILAPVGTDVDSDPAARPASRMLKGPIA